MAEDVDLAALTRPGDVVAWAGASGEPVRLLEMLNASMERVAAAAFFTNVGVSTALDPARVAVRGIRVRAVGGSGTNRRFGDTGVLDVMPGHYSSLCDMVVDGFLRIDVALIQLAADGGAFRQSPAVDYIADALPRARTVVAEVNDQAPVVEGDTLVDSADIDHVVRTSHPIVEVRSQSAGGVAKAIGEHVARLVPDGATLQTGLGALPDAVLECLAGRRDLGLHSGTIGDRAADLVDMGVITNRRKPVDTGFSITAGLFGTKRAYAWAHRNPRLRLRSPRYTHDTATHALIPNLFGINSALEVDLTGQVNAEVAGGKHIGMVGGHGDFMRGCMRSRGGRGIIALESTARGGKMSRIVPALSSGVVTTSRSDADVVVTEYGIAELRGRTLPERAKALVAIAHPDFRAALEAAAERLL